MSLCFELVENYAEEALCLCVEIQNVIASDLAALGLILQSWPKLLRKFLNNQKNEKKPSKIS